MKRLFHEGLLLILQRVKSIIDIFALIFFSSSLLLLLLTRKMRFTNLADRRETIAGKSSGELASGRGVADFGSGHKSLNFDLCALPLAIR